MTRTLTFSDTMNAPATRAVFAALEARGGKGCVRFVGGCVRNLLLGVPVSDLDLSTQLLPDETEAALAAAEIRSVPTGKAYGTITAVVDGTPFEITSLREDVETDGRRAVVKYTDDWAKDAQRRDFYVNALYADIEGTVYDPTGLGLEDIAARRVRFIGEAEQRIREDYLRILRFFRFSAGYGQGLDQASLAACLQLKDGIDGLSSERIWGETYKTLLIDDPARAFEPMLAGGVLPHLIPGWQMDRNTLPELAAMARMAVDPYLRLMALIDAGIGLDKAVVLRLQDRMRFSRVVETRLITTGQVVGLIGDVATPDDLLRLMYRFGRESVVDATYLAAAHGGKAPETLLECMARWDIPVFPLKGADLIARGMTPGPEVGQRLKQIETEWLNHDFSQSVIDRALDALAK